MDENLIQTMKRDVRYAAVNGCPLPSHKYRAVIQGLSYVTGRRCHIWPDGRHYQHDDYAHATFCEIYMHDKTGILEYPNANGKYEDHDFVKSKGGWCGCMILIFRDKILANSGDPRLVGIFHRRQPFISIKS